MIFVMVTPPLGSSWGNRDPLRTIEVNCPPPMASIVFLSTRTTRQASRMKRSHDYPVKRTGRLRVDYRVAL